MPDRNSQVIPNEPLARREFLGSCAGGLSIPLLARQMAAAKPTDVSLPGDGPAIFPAPSVLSLLQGDFDLTDEVSILVPQNSAAPDLFLARWLRDELADWFGLIVKVQRTASLSAGRSAIVIGDTSNPLVQASLREAGLAAPNVPESYVLRVRPDKILIAGADARGVSYGLQSLLQLLNKKEDRLRFQAIDINDQPSKLFRGLKVYLPGRANIAFFKRFVREFVVAHKYNTLVIEMNAAMRFETHPELNLGWRELVDDTNYSRRNYPPGALHNREQNSSHHDLADGGFLEKRQLAEIADWVRSHGIELIPELPSFTHSYYLLTRHRELSEVPGDKWPDTYCPSDSRTYELLFDIYDEYIDLLKPRMVHAGHDELFAPIGLCPRCKDRDIGERYGEDVARIQSYLKKKNVRMAMWGDMLLETVRGKGLRSKHAPDGWEYKVAGGLTPEQVQRLVPKDILIFNWFWHQEEGLWSEEQAENNETLLDHMGFQQIFGNFGPVIANYQARSKRATLLGGAPSAWFATNEFNFGKNTLADFLGCSNTLWSGNVLDEHELLRITQSHVPDIRARFRGTRPPSATEPAIVPVNISKSFNIGETELDLGNLRQGPVSLGRIRFDLARNETKIAIAVATRGKTKIALPTAVEGISIGVDASSLLFLHASAKPAFNREPDRLLWDVPDSADLLGWYEIVYEDGFLDTIPIRYGVNIAELGWAKQNSAENYCYGADPLPIAATDSSKVTFFAFEWVNPRLGKIIRELRIRGTHHFKGADPDFTNNYGPVIPSNAVILKALSFVEKRPASA